MQTDANEPAQASETNWTCVTCGQNAVGNFCANCGEKRRGDHDFSLAHVLAEAAEAFLHIDSKVFLTLKTLMVKPGKLTEEFFLGRRKPYMSPLQTFFVCNLLFFLIQPLTGLEILAPPLRIFDDPNSWTRHLIDQRLEHKHLSRANQQEFVDYSHNFDHNSRLQAKSLILVMALMLAVVISILYFQRRRYFSEHIIFSLHAYAWWLLWVLTILVATSLILIIVVSILYIFARAKLFGLRGSNLHLLDVIETSLEFGGLGLYLFFAARKFYQDKLIPGLAKGVILTLCSSGLFYLYRYLLFFTVLYTT
ncbi:MAG TPA: DUF3667 domain-containing protein [Candidatus Angelobacter sp.]|jgi:hypothetical protein